MVGLRYTWRMEALKPRAPTSAPLWLVVWPPTPETLSSLTQSACPGGCFTKTVLGGPRVLSCTPWREGECEPGHYCGQCNGAFKKERHHLTPNDHPFLPVVRLKPTGKNTGYFQKMKHKQHPWFSAFDSIYFFSPAPSEMST